MQAHYPNAELTACDLNKDGVDFCVSTFGAKGVYSDIDVSKIMIESMFDLIWCGSLLTHLPSCKSKKFLEFFIDHLDNDGILLITLQGRWQISLQEKHWKCIDDERFNKALSEYDASGYGFVDYEGFEGVGYGISLVKPSWVLSNIEERKDISVIYFAERLWNGHQDVLAVTKQLI